GLAALHRALIAGDRGTGSSRLKWASRRAHDGAVRRRMTPGGYALPEADDSVKQRGGACFDPRALVRSRRRIEVGRRRCGVVDPFAEQRAAVDHVDRELVVLVLVREVAPQRIVRIERTDRLERKRLEPPRLERGVIVALVLDM